MYRSREEAGFALAKSLRGRCWHDLLILAIPPRGIVLGAVLAQELDAELDVVLARKLGAPGQPETVVGAIAESGKVFLNPEATAVRSLQEGPLHDEYLRQLAEVVRRQRLYRTARPAAPVRGRSVLVVDDGIVTGSTLSAVLQALRPQHPRELLVAAPVASPKGLEQVRRHCDEVVCPLRPKPFLSVGDFYEDFAPVDEEQALRLLRTFARRGIDPSPLHRLFSRDTVN